MNIFYQNNKHTKTFRNIKKALNWIDSITFVSAPTFTKEDIGPILHDYFLGSNLRKIFRKHLLPPDSLFPFKKTKVISNEDLNLLTCLIYSDYKQHNLNKKKPKGIPAVPIVTSGGITAVFSGVTTKVLANNTKVLEESKAVIADNKIAFARFNRTFDAFIDFLKKHNI